jgi:3-deoxy-D-manno-octulosonate 8-phosphate phosphatase (KDO 8-P phosphatase)
VSEKSVERIEVLILDVDGVLTDGGIVYDSEGRELKRFNTKDGHGIKMARQAGLAVAIITGRSSLAVSRRAEELGIEAVLQGVKDKVEALEILLKEKGWEAAEVAYMGDDLPDLPVMRRVGFPIAVSDAVEDVLKAARYVTRLPGGKGAVREAIEFILKSSGRWEKT